MDFKERPGRAWLLQQVHDVGMHLQDLDAVGHHSGRVGREYNELVRMHHEPNIAVDRTLP